jgi:hypothetical protein
MPRDHAYELMRNALKSVLPFVETFARMAKSAPAKIESDDANRANKGSFKSSGGSRAVLASTEGSRELIRECPVRVLAVSKLQHSPQT